MATIDLRQLDAFVAVVRAGSFTAAAEQLGTQKAHVSRLISHLEERLGVRLLQRSTRALRLTEVGRECFERAVGVLQAVEETERAVRATQTEPRGTLKLTGTREVGLLLMGRWIEAYLKRYPEVNVEVDYTTRVVDLIHEGFDLAIRVGTLEDSELSARLLGELRYGLYASPDYLAARGTPMRPEELSGHDRIALVAGSQGPDWVLSDGIRKVRIDTPPRLTHNYNLAGRDAIVRGLGVGLIAVADDPMSAGGRIVRILPAWSLGPLPIHAIFPSSRFLAPKVRAFIDLAAADMARGALSSR
jgi:LysR family transcriptional regulator, regulator for bpeEF and oprC